nr:MAG TPA: hypothetical protein [Caudoviricetes sp.]
MEKRNLMVPFCCYFAETPPQRGTEDSITTL